MTGAGGFVGAHLIDNLLAAGHEVVAASHRSFQPRTGVATEIFDLRDFAMLQATVAQHKPEGVIHLAAQASVPRSWADPRETYESNVVGASNLLECVKDRVSMRILLIGSAQVYAAGVSHPLSETDPVEPSSPYAVSKMAQELLGGLYAREFALPVMMTRSFNHTGPGQSAEYAAGSFCSQITMIERGDQEPRMDVGRLDSVRDFLDVRDVADAYRLLLESGQEGETYNVASGAGVRIGDLLKLLVEIAELPHPVEIAEDSSPRAGDPDSLVGDPSKLQQRVRWEPRIPLETSLADTLDWYRKHDPAQPTSARGRRTL